MAQSSNRGRGWHGDPQGHARAGRKGGLARRKRSWGSSNGGGR